ncbi:MAG: acyl-CoA dehydrogenase family protein [Candidatus Bipolaricaulota bacterium]|nr:acyl-CoA dehydrogenase family protein [Candidatus Bipolaricaulota bacterium]MDW8031699.1 acyl-CoA dehydrogenase family protein [Candidatus Bipolaricaulota bacterium]
MSWEEFRSPVSFLKQKLGAVACEQTLRAYESYWEREGKAISEIVDRAGTPWLRMFDRFGRRIDEILFPPEYWTLLKHGYQTGIIWRAFEEQSLISSYLLGYVTSFYDPGLYCPYTVSLSTAVPLEKYGTESVRARFLPMLLKRDDSVWQGATWMTEVKGGSDLGVAVETIAKPSGDHWLLTGEKYFASNAGAELAVVAARPEGAPKTVRGLALFLLPKYRQDGSLNYTIRRLKDKIATRSVPTGEVELTNSEAYLLGKLEWGIYLILEVLNLSRVANSIGSVALTQRVLSDALSFAQERTAFGKPILEHPLLRRQFEDRIAQVEMAFALAWEAVTLLDRVWRQTPPYSEQYHLFRLVAHLAKYWTAELAAQTAKWGMEVYGGVGTLAEFGMDRWLRESMILAIWEGTPHRQMLDGLEVMERKGAHRLLLQYLEPWAEPKALREMQARIEAHLKLAPAEKEAQIEGLFRDLANFTAAVLRSKLT